MFVMLSFLIPRCAITFLIMFSLVTHRTLIIISMGILSIFS